MGKISRDGGPSGGMAQQCYCDGCGTLLEGSKGSADGCEGCSGGFTVRLFFSEGGFDGEPDCYEMRKCYCDACKENAKEITRRALADMGFEWKSGDDT